MFGKFLLTFSDGHGVLGHEVSGYLRENLPYSLNSQFKIRGKNILTYNVHNIIEDVFLETNARLISGEIVDTTFSGSTCVSLIYTPEKIITANVGDSRAVIGRNQNGGNKVVIFRLEKSRLDARPQARHKRRKPKNQKKKRKN